MVTYEGSLFLDVATQRLLDLHRVHANDRLVHMARASASECLDRLATFDEQQRSAYMAHVGWLLSSSSFVRIDRGQHRQPRPAA